MKESKLAVLMIEDDRNDAELVRQKLLALDGYDISVTHVSDLKTAQTTLNDIDIDIIVLDHLLVAETSDELLRSLRQSGDPRPVIIVTALSDATLAAKLMKLGADDFLIKDALTADQLQNAIEHAQAACSCRKLEAKNQALLQEVQNTRAELESKNKHLATLNASAKEFVDHVSHEFRTPLAVIREYAAIIRDGLAGATTPEQNQYTETIVNRVDDLCILVDDMLDYSKFEAGLIGVKRADSQLSDILTHIGPTLARRAAAMNANLSIEPRAGLPDIYCDPEKVGRIITNLVINALKFAGDPGKVKLTARADYAKHEIIVSVSDNGQGIDPLVCQLLFERFRQGSGPLRSGVKGFGLGLSIVKELVALNFGDVFVESEVGVGSTFAFSIPFSHRQSLLERYATRATQLRNQPTHLNLLEISADSDTPLEILTDTRRLLQSHLRGTDLMFVSRPSRWLLVAATRRGDVSRLVARVDRAFGGERRNCLTADLPQLTFRIDGSWRLEDQIPAFIERYLSLEQDAQFVQT